MARMLRRRFIKQEEGPRIEMVEEDLTEQLTFLRSKKSELAELEALAKSLKGEVKGMEETLIPRLRQVEGQLVRLENQAATLKEYTKTTTKWKPLAEKYKEQARTKVNPATQKVLDDLWDELWSQLSEERDYASIQFKRMSKAGGLQGLWDSISGTVTGWLDGLFGTLKSAADEMDALLAGGRMDKRINKRVAAILSRRFV